VKDGRGEYIGKGRCRLGQGVRQDSERGSWRAGGGEQEGESSRFTSWMPSKSACFSSRFKILRASSRDIFKFIVEALTAALCLASACSSANECVGEGGRRPLASLFTIV
jgi:hypothetical protein